MKWKTAVLFVGGRHSRRIVPVMDYLYLIPVGLWFQALVSDVKISLLQLVLMRWRKVPPTVIVSAMIEGKKAGIELYRDLLEAHYLAGGHVAQVVHALVSASKANIDLTFRLQLLWIWPVGMYSKQYK